MNAAILTTLAAALLGAGATFATVLPGTFGQAEGECTDLAGQGSVCQEVLVDVENGNFDANATVVIEPNPPVAAEAAAECTDLAGQGSVCHEVVADPQNGNFDANVTAVIEPNPPVAASATAPECTDLAGQGEVCRDGDQSGGSVTYRVDNAETGAHADGYVIYDTPL